PSFWQVMGNTFEYLIVGVVVSLGLAFLVAYYLDRVRVGHALLRGLDFVPHITTAVAIAWVWRRGLPTGSIASLYGIPRQPGAPRFPGDAGPTLAARRALDRAGALRRARAGDLGRDKIPDRDLPGRAHSHPAGVLRSGGHRRRGKLARPGERDAPAPPANHRVSGGRELDRLPAHLRLRVQHDERPGRAARLDQTARPQDLRDRVRPLPDG